MTGGPPPGRGKPPLHLDAGNFRGWTPAWAGQTSSGRRTRNTSTVDPRLGGANSFTAVTRRSAKGGPPPGRGKLCRPRINCRLHRWTPAWAGQTAPQPPDALPSTVDPRLGGANLKENHQDDAEGGGPPPGRGKPLPGRLHGLPDGWTPAWAGQTVEDHRDQGPQTGGPPPGRGKPRMYMAKPHTAGWTPAWAGQTAATSVIWWMVSVDPRLGGANVGLGALVYKYYGGPPPGRGKPGRRRQPDAHLRWTPAWAGQTPASTPGLAGRQVDPRLGGANGVSVPSSISILGGPPPGRGKHHLRTHE